VVTMLPASRHVEAAMLGTDGVIAGLTAGMTVIDKSAIDPGTTRRVAAAVEAKQAHMLDAPVSGSSLGAEQGTLTIMVGGDEAVLERHRELLEAMGSNVVHCGTTGMGEAVKLCKQPDRGRVGGRGGRGVRPLRLDGQAFAELHERHAFGGEGGGPYCGFEPGDPVVLHTSHVHARGSGEGRHVWPAFDEQ
jgi:hypothetical protein